MWRSGPWGERIRARDRGGSALPVYLVFLKMDLRFGSDFAFCFAVDSDSGVIVFDGLDGCTVSWAAFPRSETPEAAVSIHAHYARGTA